MSEDVHRKTIETQARKVSESAASLKATAGAVKQSTQELTESAQELTESADRRTQLAADRTMLAGERTYAAWVRTGLAALASGIGARTLLQDLFPPWVGKLTGSVLILYSVLCFVAAVWRALEPGAPPPQLDTRQLPPAVLIAVNGLLVLVGVAALVAVWG
jgi:putative membrane protein